MNKARGCVFILLVVVAGLAGYIKFGMPLVSRDPGAIRYLIVDRVFVLNNMPYLYVPLGMAGLVNASLSPCPANFNLAYYFLARMMGKPGKESHLYQGKFLIHQGGLLVLF